MNKLTLLFIVSIMVGIATLAYLTAPADAVTSRLGSDLRSSSFADLAVDSASSSDQGMGLRVKKGKVVIGNTLDEPYVAAGAKLIVNGSPYTLPEGYSGKVGSAGDAIYAFASSTNSAISAEQYNSSGYSVYAAGGKALVELNDTNTTWGSAADTFTVRNYNATTNNWAKLMFASAVDAGTTTSSVGASISAQFTDHSKYNYPNTDLVFYTANNDLAPAERLRISSAGTITVSGNKISNLGTPTASTDATTKSYVDSAASGGNNWVLSGSNFYPSSTSWLVGIGTSSAPIGKLHVVNTGNTPRLVIQNDTANEAGAAILTKNAIGLTGSYLTQFITSGNADSNSPTQFSGWISSYALEGSGSYGNYITPSQFKGWQWAAYTGSGYSQFLNLTSSGNLGVSHTAPRAKLVVNNPYSGTKYGSATDALFAYSSSATGSAVVAEQANASGYSVYSSGGKNYFGGNVGIGTAPSASYAITVSGTANFGGNVGINTTPGSYALDVSGDVNVSGSYRKGGTAGASTSCSAGQVLDNVITSGGIVTSGTCQTRGDITGVSSGTGLTGGGSAGSVTLSLNTSSYVTFGQGIVTEYQTSASGISSGVLDSLFGSSLPNGFIGVFYDSDVAIEYLAVRVNSGWHWVALN